MAAIEVEGKTVEEAIREGLNRLGCSRDKVEIKILNEGTAGLFGLMGAKPARVLLTPRETAGEEGAGVDFALAQSKAKDVIAAILKRMNIASTDINTALMTGRVLIDIKSPESNLIIGKNGQTLDALEHIVTLILSREPATRVKVQIDTEEYRRKQDERLQAMAKKAAEEVRRTGKTYRFAPSPARERRIIHMALKSEPGVETFSEGEGAYRKVGVKPKK